MKKFVNYLLVLCLIVPCAFLFAGCNEAQPANEMTLSVNPEVSFMLDANGNVLSVNLGNEDAGTIYADVDFVGKDVDSTIQIFIERAAISGHVDLTGDEVSITINGAAEADVNALKEKAKKQVEKVFEDLGVQVSVQFENVSAQAQKEALIATAKILAPEKSNEEIEEMTNEQLLQLINEKQKELKDLTYEQAEQIKNDFTTMENQILSTIKQVRTTIEGLEDQLNGLLEEYADQIPALVKTQIENLKAQIKEFQQQVDQKVNEFLALRKTKIEEAKAEYATIKEQLKTEFKTQVQTSKQNVINHLTTSKNNGTITQEQYDYYVSLIENQK